MADTDQKDVSNPAPQPAPHDPTHAGHIDPTLPRLRTFADDLSEEIKKKGATTASIVQAERERAARELALDQEEAPRPKTWKGPLMLTSALVFIGLGALVLVGAYVFSLRDTTTGGDAVQSIIFPNKVIAREQPPYQTLPALLALERTAADLSLGEIARIDTTLANASTTPQEVLRALGAPETLVREARSVMLGIHSFNRTQPFIVIEITQYDRAYGAMLSWEEEMGRSLNDFFKPENGTVPPTLTFTDRVFQNVDTRVSGGEWPILWAFPRRDVLVVTTNQYTLSEIATRLFAQRTGVQE